MQLIIKNMPAIVQPITTTDMRRDPKGLLARVKKEKVVPILTHSKVEAAIISVDELNHLHEIIKELKHELFVQETLAASAEIDRGEGYGPFKSVDEMMKHLTKNLEEDEN